jgi:hypothetical protein
MRAPEDGHPWPQKEDERMKMRTLLKSMLALIGLVVSCSWDIHDDFSRYSYEFSEWESDSIALFVVSIQKCEADTVAKFLGQSIGCYCSDDSIVALLGVYLSSDSIHLTQFQADTAIYFERLSLRQGFSISPNGTFGIRVSEDEYSIWEQQKGDTICYVSRTILDTLLPQVDWN